MAQENVGETAKAADKNLVVLHQLEDSKEPIGKPQLIGMGRKRMSRALFSSNQMDVVLKLSTIKAFDGARRILDANGRPVPGSDITLLLEEAMSPRRVFTGMKEFIAALAKARVEPAVLLNDNIRLALIKKLAPRRSANNTSTSSSTDTYKTPSETPENGGLRRKTTAKRNFTKASKLPRPVVRVERLVLSKHKHMLGHRRRKINIQPEP